MESELKLMFPTKKQLYDTLTSSWFTNAIFAEKERIEDYENRYFDTKDRLMRKDKVSIRVRRINGKTYLHTVKLGGKSIDGFSQRYEWNQESDSPVFNIKKFLEQAETSEDPINLLRNALGNIPEFGLVEICQTKFTRKIITAGFGDSLFEICLDDGFCIAGEKRVPICEMEIELISGNTADVIEFGHLIMENSEGEFSNESKLGRCLALLDEETSL